MKQRPRSSSSDTTRSIPTTTASNVIFNLPNFLSLSRIFLAPVVVAILDFGLFRSWSNEVAGLIFIVASLTDAADGYIARKMKSQTHFGAFVDPIADKIMVLSVLIFFVERGIVGLWIVTAIIERELIVMGIRLTALCSRNRTVISASRLGKTKTFLQVVAIVMLIFKLRGGYLLFCFSAFVAVVSGVQYLLAAWPVFFLEDRDCI